AGLEAAMEAAGLLGAEVMQQGLLLADGQLLARGAKPAERALSELLDVTVPDELGEIVTTSTVADLLDSISTNADDMESPDGQTVVTIDGRFRLGALRGRHAKTAAEHIGVTARRATLQRQRQAAADELAVAREALASTDVLLTQAS